MAAMRRVCIARSASEGRGEIPSLRSFAARALFVFRRVLHCWSSAVASDARDEGAGRCELRGWLRRIVRARRVPEPDLAAIGSGCTAGRVRDDIGLRRIESRHFADRSRPVQPARRARIFCGGTSAEDVDRFRTEFLCQFRQTLEFETTRRLVAGVASNRRRPAYGPDLAASPPSSQSRSPRGNSWVRVGRHAVEQWLGVGEITFTGRQFAGHEAGRRVVRRQLNAGTNQLGPRSCLSTNNRNWPSRA